jgi:drug/metabolite transporter (DMT)-like permease
MQNWHILAIAAPFFFVAYQALTKLLPKGTSVFLVNAYASLIGFAVMLVLHFALSANKSAAVAGRTLWLVVGMGLFISVGNFLIIKALSSGAPQSAFTSIFNPMYILFGVAAGLILWHEKLAWPQIVGVVLSAVGIILIASFKK